MKMSDLFPWNWGKEKKKAHVTVSKEVYTNSSILFDDVEDTAPSECEPSYYKGDSPIYRIK